jgi:hypothetical protein
MNNFMRSIMLADGAADHPEAVGEGRRAAAVLNEILKKHNG